MHVTKERALDQPGSVADNMESLFMVEDLPPLSSSHPWETYIERDREMGEDWGMKGETSLGVWARRRLATDLTHSR
jgi:hypothetical protein